MISKYKVVGDPIPLAEEGRFLKIDPKTGKICPAEPVPDTVPRVIRLSIYNPDGDAAEILKKQKFGGSPGYPLQTLIVTRKRYFEIIERISSSKKLTKDIIQEWRQQALHYLGGANDPLKLNIYDRHLFQELCDPENDYDAAIIAAVLRDTIESQIVVQNAKEKDLELSSLPIIEYIQSEVK